MIAKSLTHLRSPVWLRLPKGTTIVTCTATDNIGQTSVCSFNVTVLDTEPPTVNCSVATASLRPPDHILANVGLSVTTTDNCPDPIAIDVQVFSDESDEVPGYGSLVNSNRFSSFLLSYPRKCCQSRTPW